MAGLTSFLFQGQAPIAAPTGADTTTNYPEWLQTSEYNQVADANALATQPYTPYPGQEVYNPSAATTNSWSLANNNVGNWQPSLNQAGALTQAASQPITGQQINNYMSPYLSDVTGALTQASNYNLFNNVLPQVQSQFVGAGQAESPQQMQMANNAVYNSQTALNPALSQALQSGYQSALTAAQQQQQMEQTTGAQSANIGALTSQLGSADVANLAASGQAQDTYAQTNINQAMQNFQNQLQWPYANLSYESNLTRGIQTPTSTQTVGTTYPTSSGASPLSQAIGSGLALGSLNLRRGGHVGALSRYAAGGRSLGETLTPMDAGPDTGQDTLAPDWWQGEPTKTMNRYEKLMPRDPEAEAEVDRMRRFLSDPQWNPGAYAGRTQAMARGGHVRHFAMGGPMMGTTQPQAPGTVPRGPMMPPLAPTAPGGAQQQPTMMPPSSMPMSPGPTAQIMQSASNPLGMRRGGAVRHYDDGGTVDMQPMIADAGNGGGALSAQPTAQAATTPIAQSMPPIAQQPTTPITDAGFVNSQGSLDNWANLLLGLTDQTGAGNVTPNMGPLYQSSYARGGRRRAA